MGEGKAVARLGDTGSHGGTIILAASSIFVNGLPTARVGDIYACPEHGDNPIITGSTSVFDEEKPVAHVGSKTACGATITTGSPDTFVDDSVIASEVEPYNEQVQIVDLETHKPIRFYPFYIEVSDGQVIFGKTDKNGKAPRIYTNNVETLAIWIGDEAEKKMEGNDGK